MRRLLQYILLTVFVSAQAQVEYVDTRVGTAPSVTAGAGLFGKKTEEFGQTIPAVLVPNGMNFWTPQTRDTEQKCVAPYYYLDEALQGFRASHWIVGGCTQDYGSMTLMPLYGQLRCQPQQRACTFSHTDEIAQPDYYSVNLPSEGINAEMTGTSRAAIFNFTYDKGGKAYLVANPNSDEGQGWIAIDTARCMIYGSNPAHRIYQGKGEPTGFSGYFVVALDRKPIGFGVYQDGNVYENQTEIADTFGIGCYVAFDVADGETVKAKAATSFVSLDGALANLEAEIPHWDFEKTRRELTDIWVQHLGQVQVEGTDDQLRKFYGALYRASFLPHQVSDTDGTHPAFASGLPVHSARPYYDDYSLWDTYRALHPLLCILSPSKTADMMQSLADKYEQGGWMPIFPCWNSYTAAMIGDHAASVLADAYVKGIRGFDAEKAYEGARKNAFDLPDAEDYTQGKGRRALASYLPYGYIPLEDSVPDAYHKKEQASRTLEYAYDDFALGQLALMLGKPGDYRMLMDRAANWRNAINPTTGYADARHADGRWASLHPIEFSKHITEGAPCHYAWYVPHDPYGLMEAMGGRDEYVAKLDSMFTERRYWHGNEPCHQVAYMYNFAGQPWKTAREVRRIMDGEYLDAPGGLSGNDDAGQMSAWYVFAALGFYPVCPGTPYYMISGPTFKSASIALENGNILTLLAPNADGKNIYVKSVRHNGKLYKLNYLTHSDLMEGGTWEFEMTDRPTGWGTARKHCPPSYF